MDEKLVPAAASIESSCADRSKHGMSPKNAMELIGAWIRTRCKGDEVPVFVGLQQSFQFVNYYFHRFTKSNPFGLTALDVREFFEGTTGRTWREIRSGPTGETTYPSLQLGENSLEIALYQAQLFRTVRQQPPIEAH